MSLKIDAAITVANPPALKNFTTSIPAKAVSSVGFWTSTTKYVNAGTLDWAPRAGSIHAIPRTATLPTLVTDGVTGRQVMKFNGSGDDHLRVLDAFDSGSKSIAVGFKTNTLQAATSDVVQIEYDNTTGSDDNLHLRHITGAFRLFLSSGSKTLDYGSVPAAGGWHWAILAIKAAQMALSLDGGAFVTLAVTQPGATGHFNMNFGSAGTAGAGFWDGSIENVIADKGYAPDNPDWVDEVNAYMARLYA